MSRRAHTKSRHGCRQCKSRRIKCDEQQPQCSNCARRRQTCEWGLQDHSSAASPASTVVSQALRSSTRTASPRPEASAVITRVNLGAASASLGSLNDMTLASHDFGFDDLELMYHYSTVTSRSVSPALKGSYQVWQHMVPQEASKYKFLMHGLLGAGAMHLAAQRPDEHSKYTQLMEKHQTASRLLFCNEVTEVTPENSRAVFGYSGMSVLMGFGGSRLSGVPCTVEDFLTIVVLLRGMKVILQGSWEPLAQHISSLTLPQINILSRALLDSINDLETLCRRTVPEHQLEIYLVEVTRLKWSFSLIPDDSGSNGQPFRWPMSLDQRLVDDMRQRQPTALTLLAHYCIFADQGATTWYWESWTHDILQSVIQTVPPMWRDVIYSTMKSFATSNVVEMVTSEATGNV